METGSSIARVAALVGDPARANMLSALTDGRALTASELAYFAGVTPQTASSHLSKLTEAGLLAQQRQGRHHYYRLASPLVGRMLESLMVVADPAPLQPRWRGGQALRTARTCYDHLAGRLAVGIADGLVERGHVVLAEDGGEVTAAGLAHLAEFGIDLGGASMRRRPFVRPCLDWSERRPHLAGAIGAALASRAFELGWIERIKDSRAVAITAAGTRGFLDVFGVRPT
ncbi:MAG: ArsR/SmtB family transcription factor [Geminicoccaceae bacterium]